MRTPRNLVLIGAILLVADLVAKLVLFHNPTFHGDSYAVWSWVNEILFWVGITFFGLGLFRLTDPKS